MSIKPENAGDEIRFKAGKYKGKTGWRNTKRTDTAGRIYVIVDLGSRFKETYVRPTSIAKPQGRSQNWAEALVDQHPDIDGMIDKLCKEIGRCTVGDRLETDPEPLYLLVHTRMLEERRKHLALGPRGAWRIFQLPEHLK